MNPKLYIVSFFILYQVKNAYLVKGNEMFEKLVEKESEEKDKKKKAEERKIATEERKRLTEEKKETAAKNRGT